MLPDTRARGWVEVARIRALEPDEAPDPRGEEALLPPGPIDAALAPLDAELSRAGSRAREAYRSRTEPTRFFAAGLQARLVRSFESDQAEVTAKAAEAAER